MAFPILELFKGAVAFAAAYFASGKWFIDGVAVTASAAQLNSSGGGAVSAALTASENLAAGALVNVWDNAGTTNVRNADATDATKSADGFVLAAVTSGNPATVYFPGQIVTGLTGLTPGTAYYLDTTPGGVTTTPPGGDGNLVQQVGKALAATNMIFAPHEGVQL